MQNATPVAIAVLVLELAPAAVFGLVGERVGQVCARWPSTVRTALPALCALPYVLISYSHQMFSWEWCALYAALPVAIAWLLGQAAIADPEQRGNWRDAIILLTLGLAVDLRWFELAWPSGLAGWGKLLLVDAGLYGFVAIRRLRGTGFDFHLHWSDWKTGLLAWEGYSLRRLAPGLGRPERPQPRQPVARRLWPGSRWRQGPWRQERRFGQSLPGRSEWGRGW